MKALPWPYMEISSLSTQEKLNERYCHWGLVTKREKVSELSTIYIMLTDTDMYTDLDRWYSGKVCTIVPGFEYDVIIVVHVKVVMPGRLLRKWLITP